MSYPEGISAFFVSKSDYLWKPEGEYNEKKSNHSEIQAENYLRRAF